jgi:hypothetical protein
MADEILQNARIDQLDLGIPVAADFGVYRDMTTQTTKRFSMSSLIPSATTGNFEWTSAKAEAGDYDEFHVVTRGGKWYQSTVDNNESVPGVDATWELLTKSSSGFVMWEAGVFAEDEVFVLHVIGTSIFIFRLADATRPYVSVDFDDEFEAGDWELVGKVEVFVFSTVLITDIITLDFLNLQRVDLIESAQITEPKTWVFDNPVEGLVSFARFSVDGEHTQQLPIDVKVADASNALWNSGTKEWTPLAAGEYEMRIQYMNAQFNLIISGPFN